MIAPAKPSEKAICISERALWRRTQLGPTMVTMDSKILRINSFGGSIVRISRASELYVRLRGLRNRLWIVRMRLWCVDPTSFAHPSSSISKDLSTGAYVFIGGSCVIGSCVTIGKYTMLAGQVAIIGDDHNWRDPNTPMQFAGRPTQRKTRIGADVWIGRGAIVMRGLTIGDGSIVGAGSVVTRDIPPREVWAGSPARRIRDRFSDAADRIAHQAMLDGPITSPWFVEPQLTYEAP